MKRTQKHQSDNRIDFRKAQSILGYKDVRTLESWCHENGVQIILEYGQTYILYQEFELAFNRPIAKMIRGDENK